MTTSSNFSGRPGYTPKFVKWITTKDGRRLPPPAGKKAWLIWVKDDEGLS